MDEIKKTQVVVFAGGAGLRMGSHVPKSLLKAGGKTLMQRCLEMFLDSGFEKFALILGYQAEEVRNHVEDILPLAAFHVEAFDAGRGKALQNALQAGIINGKNRSILAFPDDVYLMSDLPSFVLSHHLFAASRHGALASVALAFGSEWPYGSVTLSKNGKVINFVEKPFVKKLSSTGFYILEPEVHDIVSENEKDFFELERDVLPVLAEKRQLNGVILPRDAWLPVNTQADYKKAVRVLTGEETRTKRPIPWPEEAQ